MLGTVAGNISYLHIPVYGHDDDDEVCVCECE